MKFCKYCLRMVDSTHIKEMLKDNTERKIINNVMEKPLYYTPLTVYDNEKIIELHTTIKIPTEHEYLIDIILDLHNRR